jgi:diguanylate cyclase (GGDEF)-like protein
LVVERAVSILESADVTTFGTQEPDSHIDDERFAYFYKDPLTHLYNHDYFDALLQKNKDEKQNLCLNILYIRNFTSYNREYGWSEGDIFLNQFSAYLRSKFSDFQIFRIFGDDFVLLSKTHREIDLAGINEIPLLKKNHLFCEHRHVDTEYTDINSYKDLQESN